MTEATNLDAILTEVGEFGLFQVFTYILICIPSALSASYVVNYMVSANTLDYRCKVPECDVGENNREIEFNQSWVPFAVPSNNGKWENCMRFAPTLDPPENGKQCSPEMFNTSLKIPCSEFIYASDERNVQTELNIHCSDSYKLALIGTANNFGRFLLLPLSGLLSDKFGRLTVVVIGMTIGSVMGLIKSFATSYSMYISFEFLESLGTSTFSGMYVLALEWVNSKYRNFGSVLVAVSFPLGEMLLGFVALYVHDFRDVIRILYTPGLFLVVYFWIVPESVRWLLVTGRVDRAIKILKRTAYFNGKELSSKSIETIKMTYSSDSIKMENEKNNIQHENNSMVQSLCAVFKSKMLLVRFLICCYQWMNCCFCYYGLSIISTHVPGKNRYISFIFVVAIEIPGLLIALPLLNHMKRRKLMFLALFMTAFFTTVNTWIPSENSIITLVFFMLAKASISCAFNVIYIYTAEQWPTNVRNTILSSCSMIGRIGAMVAPVVITVMASHFGSFPPYIFGISAIVAAFLVLLSPETFSKKLPDTIQEAKDLQKTN